MNKFIYPYKGGSISAKALSKTLEAKRIRLKNSVYKHGEENLVINWGSSRCPYPCLNKPEAVGLASHKVRAFVAMEGAGVVVPYFTTDVEVAVRAVKCGIVIYQRNRIKGAGGVGIVVCSEATGIYPTDEGKLFVEGILGAEEYRVHVFNGEVLDFQKKLRRNNLKEDEYNPLIKNHGNGYVYARKNIELPAHAGVNSIKAVEALGLDFGAVDVLVKDGVSYVLEVNTAPGITGTTVEKYAEAINKYCEENEHEL